MRPQRAAGHLVDVEDLLGDLSDRGAALADLGGSLERRVLEDLDHPVGRRLELRGRVLRRCLARRGKDEEACHQDSPAADEEQGRNGRPGWSAPTAEASLSLCSRGRPDGQRESSHRRVPSAP